MKNPTSLTLAFLVTAFGLSLAGAQRAAAADFDCVSQGNADFTLKLAVTDGALTVQTAYAAARPTDGAGQLSGQAYEPSEFAAPDFVTVSLSGKHAYGRIDLPEAIMLGKSPAKSSVFLQLVGQTERTGYDCKPGETN